MSSTNNINRRKFLGYIGCCTCGLLIPSCSTVPITERRQLSIFSENYINRQSFQLYEKVKSKAKLSKDDKALSEIKEIGEKIEDAVSAYMALSEKLFNTKELKGEAFNFSNETQMSVLALTNLILKIMYIFHQK